jgi:hypothetical protein
MRASRELSFRWERLCFAAMALFCLALNLNAQSLVAHNDLWRYRKNTTALPSGWKSIDDGNLDATWLSGAGGFGYADNTNETALCATHLTDMSGSYRTVAMRKSFAIGGVVDPSLHLFLRMDFDDGFIAWLDGNYLASANSPGSPAEPAYNADASASHESSHGDSSGQPASSYDLGAVGARLSVGTHVLAVMGLNSSLSGSSDFIQVADLLLAAGPPADCNGGTLTTNRTWTTAESPIVVCSNLTVAAGATLTIQAGVTVKFEQGVGLTVADGGRLVAVGNATNRIRFTKADDATAWGAFVIDGNATNPSPETQITYADFDSNGTTAIHAANANVFLDHIVFGSSEHAGVSLDASSFVVSHCYFPKGTASFEPGHGTGGIKTNGHGIFLRNYFGGTFGYNDVVDFTGGHRPGPIVHFINNVIASGDDDGWDLDGTDAWVEANIYAHVHRNNGTPDSSSAVSGGDFGTETSKVTIIGNLFFDCDNAMTAKQGNFFSMVNNTIVHTTKTGGVDGASGAFTVEDTTPSPTTFALGGYIEANIVFDTEQLVRNYDSAQTTVTLNRNLIPVAWSGPGVGNIIADPLLEHVPAVSETLFTNWADAQILRDWFKLRSGSPAIGTGPNHSDMGGAIPIGVNIAGAPSGVTAQTNATLTVGFNRVGFGMPVIGWPEGMGYTHYKWRLDGGTWSAETPINTPITLSGLADGAHYVEAVGKRDSGTWQDDPLFQEDAVISRTATWTVRAGAPEFISIGKTSNAVELKFVAAPNQSYTLLARDSFDAAHPWAVTQTIPGITSGGETTVTVETPSSTRFYQLMVGTQ